jgi:hypothetical protein
VRDYGQVQCHFWQSTEAQSFSDVGKLLALYLLTGPHSNGIGCYRLPDGYLMADLGWSAETVSKGFEELSREGFAYRFEGVVLVPKFLRWNAIANGNVAIARQKEFEALPKGEAKTRAARALLEFGQHWKPEFRTVLETLSKPLPEGYGKQEPNLTKPNQTICAEKPAASSAPTIPLEDGSEYEVPSDLLAELKVAYPDISVLEQLHRCRAWNLSNPKKRKTRAGVKRHLNEWLSRAQKDAAANAKPAEFEGRRWKPEQIV